MRPPSPFAPEPQRGWELPCARNDCAGRADWHVRWTSDGEVSVLCSVHMDGAAGWYVFAAHHQLSLECRGAEREWGDRTCTAPAATVGDECPEELPWLGEDLDAVFIPGQGDVAPMVAPVSKAKLGESTMTQPFVAVNTTAEHLVTVTTRTRAVPVTSPTAASQSWWSCSCGAKEADPYGASSQREAERRGQDHMRDEARKAQADEVFAPGTE